MTDFTGGEFAIGETLRVGRLGYGAMQITGPGVWGPPRDPAEAKQVLRRAVELGVTLIDTADSYGPYVSEELIHEALYPYPEALAIATKAGLVRTGPGVWVPVGRPAYLRQEAEMSLRRLGVDRLDLFQLHRVDPDVPLADQVGLLAELQAEGKVDRIGLSEVTVAQIEEARTYATIDSVQNLYNVANRQSEEVLQYCEASGIAFIPWFPIQTGALAQGDGALGEVARELGVSPAQVALAWLLAKSPVMLPIPGTSSVAHVEENIAAAEIELTVEQLARLDGLAS
ncbi:aldo/keto reductase [Ferrimicrobium sp.]|uniref:aldo/keto reductase n=1 Tax=Ferrimicrobium sp. TaxID=2926050 RepID=UPI0026067F31|nr:aldo/keto reductase [Ferrimicrobium sp.]